MNDIHHNGRQGFLSQWHILANISFGICLSDKERKLIEIDTSRVWF